MESLAKTASEVVPRIYWYGERGIVNAVVSHICRGELVVDNIESVLSSVLWGNGTAPDWVSRIQDVALVVEVGLADFGDPDLLIICDTAFGKKLVFVEAKVVSYTESMLSTSPDGTNRWGMLQEGFNSSINGQITLKYRFAKALSRWDGVSAVIAEDEAVFKAYMERLNDAGSKAPGRTLVKETILKGIFKRLGLHGISEDSCYFIALTWDTRAKCFLSHDGVSADYLPVFLDSRGTDVFAVSLRRIGWLGYAELNSALQLSDSLEYRTAFATMLDSFEPSETFYSERRSGRWSSFPEWVQSLATDIANCFDSHIERKEGSFSLHDENSQIIAKIMPREKDVFLGVNDGLSALNPPEQWQSACGPSLTRKIRKTVFSGRCVTTLGEASDFVTLLKGRLESDTQPAAEIFNDEDAAI